ncbi:MAG TPA: 4-hydroxy-tetrahydrodipicolinate synthase, partial [Armatimonadota bacterium]|nr:4-hydroxy-tetrahydrodipicolinate synthase [Armatimonadota bacterium]
ALTREAEARGANSILLVVPYYNRPPQEGLYRHFEATAKATSLPVMLYNIPPRTSADLLPETIVRLSHIPNIFALKEASGHVNRTAEVLSAARPGFRVYSGDDAATVPIMSLGGYGVVSVASNVAGRLIKDLVEAAAAGKRDQTVERHNSIVPLLKALFITTSPIPLKCALKLMGLPGGSPRPPLLDATPAEEAVVRKALEDLQLLG